MPVPQASQASQASRKSRAKVPASAKKGKAKPPAAFTNEELDAAIAAQPVLAAAFKHHPASFGLVVLHGSSQAMVNALARRWVKLHEPGKLTHISDVPGAMTCEGYTTVDLAACGTAAERNAATAFVRGLGSNTHATRKSHLVLVYDAHLAAPSTVFVNVDFVLTTSALHAMPNGLLSHALLLRVQCPLQVHPKMAAMVSSVLGTECIQAARKFAHESSKLCMGQATAFVALTDAALEQTADAHSLCELAADLEHKGKLCSRPAHALEVLALKVSRR